MTAPNPYSARAFHEATKHHRGALTSARRVDAAIIPKQYKRYAGLPSIPLPAPRTATTGRLDLAVLSSVLHFSGGIIHRRQINGRTVDFRAASCTGALYHVEAYVVCGDIEGLPSGVYHYDVLSESLRPLRDGDYRRFLAEACATTGVERAPVSLVLTSTFWRNAWRYEDRAYRHTFWDTGTLLANLLAVAQEHALEASLLAGFVDNDVDRLLGIDGRREATICVVPLDGGQQGDLLDTRAAAPSPEPVELETEPLSRVEIEYPLIWRTHEAANLTDAGSVEVWRGGQQPGGESWRWPFPEHDVREVIERRGSARRFSREPLTPAEFVAMLDAALCSPGADFDARSLLRCHLVVHHVAGTEPGIYLAGQNGSLSLLQRSLLRDQATAMALDQSPAGDAAVNIIFTVGLAELETSLGDRGHRAAQLEAGVRAGRVYLTATALGLRATALTFYDDEVASVLGLDPTETAVLMLVAAGR